MLGRSSSSAFVEHHCSKVPQSLDGQRLAGCRFSPVKRLERLVTVTRWPDVRRHPYLAWIESNIGRSERYYIMFDIARSYPVLGPPVVAITRLAALFAIR